MQIIDTKNSPLSVWKGGTTKELWIYPENSSFKESNFTCRISIATIDDPVSSFTKLSGVNRTLMCLDGNFSLEHNGSGKKVVLKPFEKCSFTGDDDTLCLGTGRDFNLMLTNCTGDINTYYLKNEKYIILNSSNILISKTITFLYVLEGSIQIDSTNIEEENLIILKERIDTFKLSSESTAKLIIGQFTT